MALYTILQLALTLGVAVTQEPDITATQKLKVKVSREYREAVDEINDAGHEAMVAHNRGDDEEAQEQIKIVEHSFQVATASHPEEYEAYCNYAYFCLHVNRFQCAIEHFENCLDRMDAISDENKWKQYMAHLAIYSLYGEASFERDKAYDNGNGDIEKTLHWMNRQLTIYPFHPGNLYDKATLLINMAAVNDTMAEAISSLQESQTAAVAAFSDCKNETASVVSDWTAGAFVTIHKIDGQSGVERAAYIAEFHAANMSGDDGVIIPRNGCEIYVPSGVFTNLATNIRLKEIWTTEVPSPDFDAFKFVSKNTGPTKVKIKKLPEAASIIGFASSDFYHSLIELGSRLLMLSEFLQNTTIPFIVPKSKTITSLIKMLGIKNPIVIYESALTAATRFQVGKLWYAHWASCDVNKDGCHCTPPAHILRKLQAALVPNPSLVTPNRTLYLPRGKSLGSRKLRNAKKILQLFPEAEWFYPDKVSLESAIETFQAASRVIGVHGGALANILFCQPGTNVVEFGWPQVPMLGHFRHLSAALDLNHHTVPVDLDPRGSVAAKVTVNVELAESMVATLNNDVQTRVEL